MDMNHCSIYNKPNLAGVFVTVGDGTTAHRHCYDRAHPPREATNLREMMRGGHPFEALEAVRLHATDDQVSKMLEFYNILVRRNWERRCKDE